jgi:hypothetical protein
MFEVGAKYEFRILERGDDITFQGVVETYDHPLVKLRDSEPVVFQISGLGIDGTNGDPEILGTSPSHPGRIINVTSPSFVTAQKLLA